MAQTPASSRETSNAPLDVAGLRTLLALSNLALDGADLDGLFHVSSEAITARLDVEHAGVFEVIGGDQPRLQLRTGAGWRPGEVGRLTIPLRTDDPLIRDDATFLLPGDAQARAEVRLVLGQFSGLVVPVRAQENPYGVIVALTTDRTRTFGTPEAGFLRSLATLLGSAIERKAVEDSLRDSEQRMKMAQEIAHMGSFDWHIATDTNVWSDEMYRIYGTEPGSFHPSYEKFLSFIHPNDRARVEAIHRQSYETGEPFVMEERIIRPDGTQRILLTNGRVITDEAGHPVRMTGICLDVTEQREAEGAADGQSARAPNR